MKISDKSCYKLWNREDMKKEISAIKKRNPKAFRNWESKCKWEEEDSPEALNFMVYEEILRQKKDVIYIEVDNQPTFWWCRDDTDGFLIHENVTDVIVDGKYLTVFYDGKKQDYKFIKKFERYDKLMRPRRQKKTVNRTNSNNLEQVK